MKRWLLAGLLLAISIGNAGWVTPASAQDAPTAAPVREFAVGGGHFVGLSPDGTMYAVAIPRSTLCVYSAETLAQISCGSLEPVDAGIRFEDVAWSPDSTRLAFAEQSFVFGVDGDLWVMDARTGELANITDDGYVGSIISMGSSNDDATFFLDVTPAWTPDSQFLTFSRSGVVDGERTGNVLAQVSATGGEVETLAIVSSTEAGIVYFGTGWAPDGQTFYYSLTSIDQDNPDNGIWTYDAATGEIAPLATAGDPDLGPLTLLQVSPSGDQLLAWYPQAFSQLDVSAPLLRLVDTSTGTLTTPVSPTDVPDTLRGFVWATFSPDGTALLMLVSVGSRQNELWVTDLATGTQTKVLDGFDSATLDLGLTPGWGANGNVAFGHGIGGGYLTSIAGIGSGAAPVTAAPIASPAATPAAGTPVGGPVRYVETPLGRPLTFSPNGQYLVILVDESLCVYDVESMTEISCGDLTGLNSGIDVTDIAWSPDSSRLAFAEKTARKDGDLWVMEVQTGQVTNLTGDGYDGQVHPFPDDQNGARYFVDIAPAWTPDGQFITFARASYDTSGMTGIDIAQIPAAGGTVETLAPVTSAANRNYFVRAAWSSDGAFFYYSIFLDEEDDPNNGIWVFEQATGETRLLATSDNADFGPLVLMSVSPAGDRLLVYYSMAALFMDRMDLPHSSVLRFVDPASGALSPVPDPVPESATFVGASTAAFSPDGRYLLQAVIVRDTYRDFWVTNLETGVSNLVAHELDDAVPVAGAPGPMWASNGLVFVPKTTIGAYFFPIEGAGITPGVSADTPLAASPVSETAEFAVDSDARTIGIAPIFAAPNANAPIAGFLPPNHVVRILAEPVENDAGIWYPILDPETQIVGYVQAGRLGTVE